MEEWVAAILAILILICVLCALYWISRAIYRISRTLFKRILKHSQDDDSDDIIKGETSEEESQTEEGYYDNLLKRIDKQEKRDKKLFIILAMIAYILFRFVIKR